MRDMGAGKKHEDLVAMRTEFLNSVEFKDHQETQRALLQEHVGISRDEEPPAFFDLPEPRRPRVISLIQDYCDEQFGKRPSEKTIRRAEQKTRGARKP